MTEKTVGPYVQVAALFEKVLNEGDGTSSFVRMVDRFGIPKFPDRPGAPQVIPIIVTLAICLKAGMAKGNHSIRIVGRDPSATEFLRLDGSALFESEDRGHSFFISLEIPTTHQGVHWIDVFVEERFMTSIPFRTIHQEISLPAAIPGQSE